MKVLFLVFLISSSLSAQDVSPLSQAELLSSYELEYIEPVDRSTRSLGPGQRGLYAYQLGVEIDHGSSIALVSFEHDTDQTNPVVFLTAKVATLATNDQDVDITVVGATDDHLTLNADWRSTALFEPKHDWQRYRYGKLTTIYREGIGLVYIYYLSRDNDFTFGELFQFMNLE